MIIVGDIAIPELNSIRIEIAENLRGKNWIGNLEGGIILDESNSKKNQGVFNGKNAIDSIFNKINFVGVSLANNHILDTNSLLETIFYLNEKKISHCGAGLNINEAKKPIVHFENGVEIIILNFGWEVIQCKVANGKTKGVNPLTRENTLSTLKSAKEKYPNAKIITIMHWSYELEGEPQPFERELAKYLIDNGADGIIGCHPHRIGGFELYKNKPIVYSLGNWMFKQFFYRKSKLKFPDFCNQELAFEWDLKTNEIKFHFFNFNPIESTLIYTHSEDINSDTMTRYTPFRGLSNEEYKVWYKKNHYHKGKGLPIYYWEDSNLKILIKNKINKLRDLSISIIHKSIQKI
ncbi:MAG: CapA family protein [Macellibacteroides fermentans]|uniref:CapA family protein n=1 Tax=Macellibacteroides fermentans TaxID=879969 RepID=UPI003ABFCB06